MSELKVLVLLVSAVGFGSGGGKANSRDVLSKVAVGDNRLTDIL